MKRNNSLIKRFIPYFYPYKHLLFFDLFCAALTTVCELVLPMILRYITNQGLEDLAALSVGTIGKLGLLYLALRIALQDLFFEEETLPLMFDDGFVYFDDKRLERLLKYLGELGRQVLIFSCHKREMRILEKHQIPYQKILI